MNKPVNHSKFYFCLISTLCFSLKIFATPDSSAHSYVANINYSDYTVKATVCLGCKISPVKTREYHWISYHNIKITQGGYDGRLLHGPYTASYLTEQLKEKGNFNNGLKHGEWATWYINGKLKTIGHWDNGLREGVFLEYDANGRKLLEENYKKDRLHGKSFVYNGSGYDERKYRHGEQIIKKKKEERRRKKDVEKLTVPDSVRVADTLAAAGIQPSSDVKEKKNERGSKKKEVGGKKKEVGVKKTADEKTSKKEISEKSDIRHPTADSRKKFNWKFWKKKNNSQTSDIRIPKSEIR
jgi:hypothetical protein